MANTTSEFNISKDGYTAFDATSLRDLIVQRLTQNGVFTDQNYVGSNISSVIEIVAYTYHVLLFYLNQTSSESQFSQATLFENINKIVKSLNYNPIGYQTATLAFQCVGSETMPPGTYTIPRYSYLFINGFNYSFNSDVTFTKTASGEEILSEISDRNLLYQGTYTEYPTYIAAGDPFEQLSIVVTDKAGVNVLIDHFNIDVYVRDNTIANAQYEQYTPTESLFLESSNAKKFEIRLNEKGRYEVKFGNNIHGKQLNANDEVAIYYIKSDGVAGQVGEDTTADSTILFYNSTRYETIKTDAIASSLNLITTSQASKIAFSNSDPSTPFQDIESVESIRVNAVNTFKTQFRLLTTSDFETFLSKNFSNILASVKCVNNTDYISSHLKYYFEIGVEKPNIESRVLLNQVKFSSSCNHNNVYLYCVPKLDKVTSLNARLNYLSTAQKQLITNKLKPYKVLTSEPVFMDPVYCILDFGVKDIGETLTPAVADDSYLEITASSTQRRNFNTIRQSVADILQAYFKTTNDNLGLQIDMSKLSTDILQIEGVQDFRTVRKNQTTNISLPGLSFIIYNPVYSTTDITTFQQNYALPYFKFPILKDAATIIDRIQVISS